jgi:hypothetical protein
LIQIKTSTTKKMKMQTVKNTLKSGIVALAVAFSAITGFVTKANAQTIRNVVLVHGAFADGSG